MVAAVEPDVVRIADLGLSQKLVSGMEEILGCSMDDATGFMMARAWWLHTVKQVVWMTKHNGPTALLEQNIEAENKAWGVFMKALGADVKFVE